ncbi:MAG: hypothetical protein LC126_26075 [Bryobacterales bacterium]|nr:hypothetical protein [Bryobacterales bacterium]
MSLPPRKLWAFCASLLMLGLLGGLCDLAGRAEPAVRVHRARGARASKPDSDHSVPDVTHGSFSGNAGLILASQETPRRFPVVAGLPIRPLLFHADWVEAPLAAEHTIDAASRAGGSGGARAPPQVPA